MSCLEDPLKFPVVPVISMCLVSHQFPVVLQGNSHLCRKATGGPSDAVGARMRVRPAIIRLEDTAALQEKLQLKQTHRRRLATLSQLNMSTTSHLPPRVTARKPACERLG